MMKLWLGTLVGVGSVAVGLWSPVGVKANSVAAESNTQQLADGSGPTPAIVCDILTTGDSIPPAPRLADTRGSVSPGEAIVQTTIACTGIEDEVVETETWTGVDPAGPVTYTSTATSPTQYTYGMTYMPDGQYELRTYTICIHATAAGFAPADACNTLQNL